MAIPVVDFSKINGKDRASTLAEIDSACSKWGFFQIVNHGIPLDLLERVKKVSDEWFKVEREKAFWESYPVKAMNNLDLDGEEAVREKLKNMDWEDVITLTDDLKWPSFPNFRETMKEYRSEIRSLAKKMLEVFDENLGLEKGCINKAFCCNKDEEDMVLMEYKPFYGTKVSHYPPCPRPDLTNGLRAHTDAGGLILLFQDDKVGGLQMMKDGEWLDVKPMENTIVINTGDQIEVLSNGRYKSAPHRVRVMPTGMRRSVASFYNPALKAVIAPAPIKTKEEVARGPLAYPKFMFEDYMEVYGKQKFMAKEPRFLAVKTINSA